MPRAIWSGAISFGLVSVPVKLYTAVSRKSVRFNQIDAETNSRVKQKRVNAEGDEVSYEQIVKGYEISKDSYVIVTEEELAALSPKASRMIDITDFVLEEQIDPVFYDSAYFLVPDELARKSYTLLSRAMEDSGRVAIATFVMRTKQYLVAIRPTEGRLMMSTMVYADELVSADDIPGLEELAEIDVSEAEMTMAGQLIESLANDFEPDQYRDSYREQVLDLLEQKASGEIQSIEAAPAAEEAAVVDLLAALEASVNAAKEARKKPTKKSSAKKAKKSSAKKASKGEEDEAEQKAKSA